MKRKFLTAAISTAVLALGAAGAKATILTETVGPTLFNNGGSNYAAGIGGSFNFPEFDPSLGVLLSVQLTVQGNSFGGSNGLHNFAANAGLANVSIGSKITVTGPSALVVLTDPNQTVNGAVTAYTGNSTFDFTGSDALYVSGTSSTDTESSTLLSSFAPYEGLGNVTFNFTSSVDTSSNATVSPEITSSTATTYNFTPTVVYTYSVPEPGSLALLGLGSASTLLRRRRRA